MTAGSTSALSSSKRRVRNEQGVRSRSIDFAIILLTFRSGGVFSLPDAAHCLTNLTVRDEGLSLAR
jgi:hypothetical protein